MSISVLPPKAVFFDDAGTPLEGGQIFIGELNKDAEQYPVTVYWDAARTIVASQPLRTLGGYLVRNGAAAEAFAANGYSITVKDKYSRLVYSNLSDSAFAEEDAFVVVDTLADLAGLTGKDSESVVLALGRLSAGDGYYGEFRWVSGDQSANVSADPRSGVWVAPTTASTGASGAWKRIFDDRTVRPEWFGAIGDGVTDDYESIQAAINWLPAEGGEVVLKAASYAVGTKLVIGNGTSATISTRHGVVIHGVAAGVGAGEYGAPNILSSIKWIGAIGSSEAVVQFLGGIHSCRVKNLIIDCNGRAGTGYHLLHTFKCRFENTFVDNWYDDGWAWDCESYDADPYGPTGARYTAGTTQGFMENTFRQIGSRTPRSTRVHGMRLKGGKNYNVGCSRNRFEQVELVRGSTSDSVSLEYDWFDNNDFNGILCVGIGATPNTGIALRRKTQSTGTFNGPKANRFFGTALIGEIVTVDDTTGLTSTDGGNDIVFGYGGIDDGAPLTMPHGFRAHAIDGRVFGKIAGSAEIMKGFADPATALGTTSYYFSPVGRSAAGISFTGNNTVLSSVGGLLSRFIVNLVTAPGAGTSRTFTVRINNVDTSLTLTFGAGQFGQKVIAADVPYSGGETIEIYSAVNGVPVNSGAQWAITNYPGEVI